jgi:hypothetical protein
MLGKLRRLVNRLSLPVEAGIMQSDYPVLSSSLDYALSPYTGWTRQHWDELATLVLRGILGFFSPGRSVVNIPGHGTPHGHWVDGLEGYVRSLTVAAPWFVQRGGGEISQGITAIDLLDCYQTGLRHGTDPTHKEYWGDISDYDQRIVEAADLAWCLYIACQYLWEPLSTTEKDQVAGWLAKVIGKKVKLNNWILFKVMVNMVLRALGCSYSEREIQQGLGMVEDFYVGDGWYQDGLSESFDYYVGWMFHDYLLRFTLIEDGLIPSDAQRYLERVGRFLTDYQHFFAADGSHPSFGRSQIYRAAATAPIVMSVLVGEETLSPGLSRRLASGSLKFFLTHGMLSKRGNLTLGFTRTLPSMVEGYSCGGSPYWIGKAFNVLLLPSEHPFWTVVEEPLPVEQQDYSIAIPVAGLLLDGEKQGGQVQLINHKSGGEMAHSQKKYGNFAYSSHFGYEATIHQGRYNYDSAILLSADSKTFYGRRKPFHLQTLPGFGASFFLPFGDTKTVVYTNTIFCNHFQIRVHWLVSSRSVEVVEGGYALGYDEGTPTIVSGPDWEFAGHGARGTFIQRLIGYNYNIPARGLGGNPEGNNVLYRYSVTPGVGLPHGSLSHILLAALVRGCVNGERPEDLADFVKDVQHGLGWVIMNLQSGDVIFTQAGSICDKTIQLNGANISGRTTFAWVSGAGEVIAHYQDCRA